jgi:type I restriction enzyme M protein
MISRSAIERIALPGLGPDGRARIADEIRRLDPAGRYVRLDVDAHTVEYSSDIIQHEDITWTAGDEEPVRAYIVCWLCTKAGYLPANLELEKPYSIGRPKRGAQLDILITRPDGTPYALIEVKSPDEWGIDANKFIEGQLFNIAPHEAGATVLSFATVEVQKTKLTIKSTTIPYASQSFAEWLDKPASSSSIPTNYGEPFHEHYERDGARDLEPSPSRQELEKLRVRLHNVLWRGSKPDNLIYEYVVKLFLAKIFDEKTTRSGERYRFQVYFTGTTRESTEVLFRRIDDLYLKAYDRYLNIDSKEQPQPLSEAAFSADQIAFVVELLQGVSLTSTDAAGGDLLGGFFEGITRDGFKQSKGLFFTHLNIAVFLLCTLDIAGFARQKIQSSAVYSDRLPYIIDPSCGSGTFLLAAMHLVTRAVTDARDDLATNSDITEFLAEKFPLTHPNVWAKDFIFGIEDSELLAMSTKVNMVLHRDGNTHIYRADGLARLRGYSDQRLKPAPHPIPRVYGKPVSQSFDVVVSNPPFSITLDPHTGASAEATFELASTTNSENLFLERWYQLLKPGGRLGVVMPESFFATRENLQARLFLFDHFDVKAVVSLPRHAFEPWTPTRTSLLFARKKSPEAEDAWLKARMAHEAIASDALKEARRALARLVKAQAAFLEDGAVSVAVNDFDDIRSMVAKPPPGLAVEDATGLAGAAESFDRLLDLLKEGSQNQARRDAQKVCRRRAKRFAALSADHSEGAEKLEQSLATLEIDMPNADIGGTPDELGVAIGEAKVLLKQVDVAVWAFRRMAPNFDYSFPVVSTTNIGYKRTRRKEYDRRNDLFVATTADGDTRIQNLNTANRAWTITVADGASDALAQLRQRDLWA